MKLLKRYINFRDATGTISLVAEDAEDMWHIYNLIGEGDHVRTTAQRYGRWRVCAYSCVYTER
jgi:protein pelota